MAGDVVRLRVVALPGIPRRHRSDRARALPLNGAALQQWYRWAAELGKPRTDAETVRLMREALEKRAWTTR